MVIGTYDRVFIERCMIIEFHEMPRQHSSDENISIKCRENIEITFNCKSGQGAIKMQCARKMKINKY